MTLTLPDLDVVTAVDEPVPCEARHVVDGVMVPCPEVATWDLILECPDGATKVRHACDADAEAARRVGGLCGVHGGVHPVHCVAAYPRSSR